MADTPQIKVGERLSSPSTYKKWLVYVVITIGALILLSGVVSLGINVKNFFFPKPEKQTASQKVVTTPFSHVDKIEQTSTQLQLNEKPWEVGVGAGGITYDNKNGGFIGAWVRRRW